MNRTQDKFHIVYFSGTGGTALVANTLLKVFKKNKMETKSSEIFQNDIPKLNENETLVLIYPVYAADAPSPVYKWIRTLKRIYCNAIVISVSGGGEISPNTACRSKSIKRLERKGFNVKSEYMLCMPSNFILPTRHDIAVKLIQILPEKCSVIANEIINKTENRKKYLILDRIMLVFFSAEKFGSKFFGKTLKTNEKCNGCELCAQKCPQANIKIVDNRPKFGWHCVLCMRCVYSCPQSSIKSHMPILKKAILKEGFNIKSIQKQAQEHLQQEVENKNLGGLWKGVELYIKSKSV